MRVMLRYNLIVVIYSSVFLAGIAFKNSYLQQQSSRRRVFAFAATKRSTTSVLDKPKWAAGGIVSDMVNALISFKPLFSIVKVGARNTLIDTAEKNNIPWRLLSNDLKGKMDILDDNFNSIVDSAISYPSYYTQEFHAYSEGNLNWEAACECESATMSMAIRTWPKESLSVKQAQDRLRNSFIDAIKEYSQGLLSSSLVSAVKSPFQVQRAIDIGCSVGVSTFYLADAFPEAESILGLDLSPHFLAVARGRQMRQCGLDFIGKIENDNDADSDEIDTGYDRIQWKHANIESTDIPDNHYDLVACSFVFHELPSDASQTILKEMHRITKPGGVVAITDINPGSAVIQNLPPAIFTMMKSTEPWSDQYYALDLVEALQQAGFVDALSTPTDPRHHTILGRKPYSGGNTA